MINVIKNVKGKFKTDIYGGLDFKVPIKQLDAGNNRLRLQASFKNETKRLELAIPVAGNKASVKFFPEGGALREGNKTVVYSRHALCRMNCRHIDETEVKEILKDGTVNFNKIEENDKGIPYPVEGTTHEGQHVRIVFAPHENKLTVVTVIDLDKEWECDCG